MPRGIPPSGGDPPRPQDSTTRDTHILGLSTAELAGLSVDEITGNKTAITMIMHYYKQLVEENQSLRNDLNTLNTYVQGYEMSRTNARVGAFLLVVANISVGFGVNLLTSKQNAPGLATLIPGLCMALVGTYFSLRESR
jgi:hypothetical protein